MLPFIIAKDFDLRYVCNCTLYSSRECVRILDLRVQVHHGELWVSKQRVQAESDSDGQNNFEPVAYSVAL